MLHRLFSPGLAGVLLLLSSAALATSFDERSLAERAASSDRVLLAQVLESRTEAPAQDPRRMTTLTRVVVREDYIGRGEAALEVMQLGGKQGLWESRIPGDATFVPGETVVLFLRCPDPQRPSRCSLNGLGLGRMPVVQGAKGQEVLVPSVSRGEPTRKPLEQVVDEIRAGAPIRPGASGVAPRHAVEVKR